MIKLLLILSFLGSLAKANHHIPESESNTVSKGTFRYFKKQGELRWLAEIQASDAFNGGLQHHLDLGFKYRIFNNSKLGLIHRYQKNVRHEDNWVWKNGDWEWNEEDNAYESVLIPHWDFRILLSDQLRADLVFQYIYNTSNGHQSMKVRPGLNYFWFLNGKMFANIYLQYEQIVPFNYGNKSLAEEWFYLGFLYHLNSNSKLGISMELGEWIWTDSKEFEGTHSTQNYEIEDKAKVIGLTYIFTH